MEDRRMYCVNLFRFLRYSVLFSFGHLRRLSAAAWLGTLCIGLAACEPSNVKNLWKTTQARPVNPENSQDPKAAASPAVKPAADPSLASLSPAPYVTLTPPEGIRDQVPVGLLLPLSGRHARLGKSLLRAAQLRSLTITLSFCHETQKEPRKGPSKPRNGQLKWVRRF